MEAPLFRSTWVGPHHTRVVPSVTECQLAIQTNLKDRGSVLGKVSLSEVGIHEANFWAVWEVPVSAYDGRISAGSAVDLKTTLVCVPDQFVHSVAIDTKLNDQWIIYWN